MNRKRKCKVQIGDTVTIRFLDYDQEQLRRVAVIEPSQGGWDVTVVLACGLGRITCDSALCDLVTKEPQVFEGWV